MAKREYILVESIGKKSSKKGSSKHHKHHEKHHERSSPSGRTGEDQHHSFHSYSSRHEHSHSTHHRDGGSRGDPNPIPWSSPAGHFPDPNITTEYTNSQYFYPMASFDDQQYQHGHGPIRVCPHEGEQARYIGDWSRNYGGHYGSSGITYFPSQTGTSTWEAGYGNGETIYSTGPQPQPGYTSSEPANDIPLPIQQATIKGSEAIRTLKDIIRVVLLHEWCMVGDKVCRPSKDFKTAIKVIPIRRDKHGAFQPIESKGEGTWGVKTGYHPEHDMYLSTILIRVPSELRGVTEGKVKAAYARFFAKARNERLEDVLEIPFKNNSNYQKYGMLFTFEKGGKPPRLFDDYLCEDAVIRLQT
ncbi:hypothetical protein F5B21DRAFT_521943 [Xylaria acuta]|nr:hypothetical protein F5B21DRAFT_521943 [Xylaria acuta]